MKAIHFKDLEAMQFFHLKITHLIMILTTWASALIANISNDLTALIAGVLSTIIGVLTIVKLIHAIKAQRLEVKIKKQELQDLENGKVVKKK